MKLLESFVREAAEEQKHSFIQVKDREIDKAIASRNLKRMLTIAREVYERIDSGEFSAGDPRVSALLEKVFKWYTKFGPGDTKYWVEEVAGEKNLESVVEMVSKNVGDHKLHQLARFAKAKAFPNVATEVFLLLDQSKALEFLVLFKGFEAFYELVVKFVSKFLKTEHDVLAVVFALLSLLLYKSI